MNEKLDYKFGKYDLDFLIKLKAHEFRKQKIRVYQCVILLMM